MLCQNYGINLAGVILNKVLPDKYEETKKYMSKALLQMWDIPLLGCIPDKVCYSASLCIFTAILQNLPLLFLSKLSLS